MFFLRASFSDSLGCWLGTSGHKQQDSASPPRLLILGVRACVWFSDIHAIEAWAAGTFRQVTTESLLWSPPPFSDHFSSGHRPPIRLFFLNTFLRRFCRVDLVKGTLETLNWTGRSALAGAGKAGSARACTLHRISTPRLICFVSCLFSLFSSHFPTPSLFLISISLSVDSSLALLSLSG